MDNVDYKTFYEDMMRCPYVRKMLTQCPWFSGQVQKCPWLTDRLANDVNSQEPLHHHDEDTQLPPITKTVGEYGIMHPHIGNDEDDEDNEE